MGKRSVRRRFEIEALERRETPSAGLGGSAIHELAARPKTVALRGSGTAVYNSDTSATLSGKATVLGFFNGTLTATSPTTATVVLDSGDDQLDMTIAGHYGKGKAPRFSGTFVITGGTNAFADLTGKGTITGALNEKTETLKFNISGKVIE